MDTVARQNTEALHALWPAYEKLQDFQDVLRTLKTAGLNTAMSQIQYQQDLDTIREREPPPTVTPSWQRLLTARSSS